MIDYVLDCVNRKIAQCIENIWPKISCTGILLTHTVKISLVTIWALEAWETTLLFYLRVYYNDYSYQNSEVMSSV